MNDIIGRYGYALAGIGLVAIYFALIAVFVRRHPVGSKGPTSWWWYVLIGPAALLRWYANRSARNSLLSKRENFGWLAVLALVAAVIVWKLATKP